MKRLIATLALISCFQVYTEVQDPTTLFLGNIKFPKNLNHTDLCIYYKGQKLNTDWDKHNLSVQYSFLEAKTSQNLYLLICNNITCHTTLTNTIQHLQLTDNQYRCYHLQASRIHDEQEKLVRFSWDCQECELKNGVVPDNTIIFLFDPHIIDDIQVHTWSKNQAMRLVPTITISNNATAPEIVRAITIARLTAIDLDTIHIKEKTTKNFSTLGK